MDQCIFCKILEGEIPSYKIYEDEHVLAFLDISQITKGHTLVIPKVHNETIFDMSEETAAKLFAVVPAISRALKQAFQPQGLNMLNNNGSFAGQEVFHYHLHLIPRYDENDGFGTKYISHIHDYTQDDMLRIREEITAELQK